METKYGAAITREIKRQHEYLVKEFYLPTMAPLDYVDLANCMKQLRDGSSWGWTQ